MKIFISHKQEDALAANQIASELRAIHVDYYLDLLDPSVTQSGRELTNHIRNNLNNCTDIIVVMSVCTNRYANGDFFERLCFVARLFTILASLKETCRYPKICFS